MSFIRNFHGFRTTRLPGRRTASRAPLAALAFLVLLPGLAAAKIRVVASITDLASIASVVGGDRIEVVSIAKSNQDPHRIEVLPSYMVRVSRAKIYLKVGLTLDQWADRIIDGSHNANVQVVDCSRGVSPLEVPTARVDARQGDVHPGGNPHYWLDPHNGAIVARTIADALARVDPAHGADFQSRADAFAEQCEATRKRGIEAVSEMAVKQILTYHKSWIYLERAFGFEVAGNIEPVPGIPPTARHLQELVTLIQQRELSILLQEPYFSDDAGDFLKRRENIEVYKISPSCADETPGSYLDHFNTLIDILAGGRKAG